MKVAVLGVSGRVGSRVTDELLRRGHQVTGIARDTYVVMPGTGLTLENADVKKTDLLMPLLRGHDAVIRCTRFVDGGEAPSLIDALKQAGVRRLLVVGGAGSLMSPAGTDLVDTVDFPEAYKAEALAGRAFLQALQREKVLEWTFLSPAAEFAPGLRSGKFRLGGDKLLLDANGRSFISMEDYAIALVDELEHPAHPRRRFTVAY